MCKLMLHCIFLYIIWCSSLVVCRTTSEVTRGRGISRLIDEIKVNKSQASALTVSHPRRMLGYFEYHEMSAYDAYLNDILQKSDPFVNIKSQNMSSSQKHIQPSFGSHILFGSSETTRDQYQRSARNEIPPREEFTLQEVHLRYLMSSTAEQPDNSGRTSTFSVWLTVLIAALAAAILS